MTRVVGVGVGTVTHTSGTAGGGCSGPMLNVSFKSAGASSPSDPAKLSLAIGA